MAIKTRFPGSSDWTATAYWSGGTVPVNTDSVVMYEGNDQIDTNLPASLSLVNFTRGPGCMSGLGSESSPFAPTITGEMLLGGTLAPNRFDHIGAGASGIAKLRHVGFSPSLRLSAGTIAHLAAAGRGAVRVTQNCVLSGEVWADNPEANLYIEANATRAALMIAVSGKIITKRGMNAAKVIGSPVTGKGSLTLIEAADISDTGNTGLLELYGGDCFILSDAAATPEDAQIDGDVMAFAGLLTGAGNTFGDLIIAGDLTGGAGAQIVRKWAGGKLVVSGSEVEPAGVPTGIGL
jgi:hypothetical protein